MSLREKPPAGPEAAIKKENLRDVLVAVDVLHEAMISQSMEFITSVEKKVPPEMNLKIMKVTRNLQDELLHKLFESLGIDRKNKDVQMILKELWGPWSDVDEID